MYRRDTDVEVMVCVLPQCQQTSRQFDRTCSNDTVHLPTTLCHFWNYTDWPKGDIYNYRSGGDTSVTDWPWRRLQHWKISCCCAAAHHYLPATALQTGLFDIINLLVFIKWRKKKWIHKTKDKCCEWRENFLSLHLLKETEWNARWRRWWVVGDTHNPQRGRHRVRVLSVRTWVHITLSGVTFHMLSTSCSTA